MSDAKPYTLAELEDGRYRSEPIAEHNERLFATVTRVSELESALLGMFRAAHYCARESCEACDTASKVLEVKP